MKKYNLFDGANFFASIMLLPKHNDLTRQTYKRFPKRVKRKLESKRIILCDWFWKSKYPDQRISGMPLGFYNTGSKLIDIISGECRHLSNKSFIGLIAHEVAHAIINNSFTPIRKKLFKIKFNNLPHNLKKFYREPEELHANWLAKKWGFIEEIDLLNQERQIRPQI